MRFATRIGLFAMAFGLAAGSASAQDKNVTFQVNMQPYIDSCQHGVDDVMEIRGNVFGWDDTAPDMTYDGDGTYSITVQQPEDTAISYKFYSAGGLEYEDQTGDRTYTVTSDADQTVDEVTFADGDPSDSCTAQDTTFEFDFTVDMSVQTSRGAFDPDTQVPGVAGDITSWGDGAVPLSVDPVTPGLYIGRIDTNPDGDPIVRAAPGSSPYKFVIINTADNSIAAWESGSDRQIPLNGDEPDNDGDGALEVNVAERFFNDVTQDDVLQSETTVMYTVDLNSAAFYLGDNASIPGTPEAVTEITGLYMNGPAMWESVAGGGPGDGITDWLGWGDQLAARSEFAFSDGNGDNIWELELTYPAGALRTLVGKLGINGMDNEGGFGNDSFYPVGTGAIDLVFGAMLTGDGTYRDDCGPDADADGTCDPIYDPYILLDNSATPPTAMAVDGTGGADVANERGPGLAEGVSLSAPRPNPASGQTSFVLSLENAQVAHVAVFDLMGRNVATLAEGTMAAGETTLGLDTTDLAAGLYIVRVQAGGEVATRRLTIVR